MKKITLDEAEKLAMETDYACFAAGCEINEADAGAFFLEGYNYAVSQISCLQNNKPFVIPAVSVQLPTVKDVRSKAMDYSQQVVCEEEAKRFRKYAKDDFIEGAEWMRTKAVGN